MGSQSKDPLMLHVGGVFITTDGYLDSKTAALTQPYSDDLDNNGKMLLTEQELAASVTQVLDLRLQPVIHAMGDKAIDTALKVIERTKSKGTRFRIEQAAVLNAGLIKRLKASEVIVTVQPTVIATEFAVWSAEARLGIGQGCDASSAQDPAERRRQSCWRLRLPNGASKPDAWHPRSRKQSQLPRTTLIRGGSPSHVHRGSSLLLWRREFEGDNRRGKACGFNRSGRRPIYCLQRKKSAASALK